MRLTFAALTYFILNTFAVTAIISLTESKSFLRVWRECYLWVFPFFLRATATGVGFHYVAARVRLAGSPHARIKPGIYILHIAYHFYLGRLQTEKVNAQDIAALHLRTTIGALRRKLSTRSDQTTHDHRNSVHVYASEIAQSHL